MNLDEETLEYIDKIRTDNEFFTFLILPNNVLKYGIVQNETTKVVMFYDFDKIKTDSLKKTFMRYADEWWWQSNRSVPIDSFIGNRFDVFYPTLIGYPKKGIVDIIGHRFSISKLYLKKRIKKKKIEILNINESL